MMFYGAHSNSALDYVVYFEESNIFTRERNGILTMRRLFFQIILLIAVFSASSCLAMQVHKPFVEVVHEASDIFIGTVTEISPRPGERGRMVFTDVTFENLNAVKSSRANLLSKSASLTLSFAGGTWGDRTVRVSDVPTLRTGERYVLFVENRETPVPSPLVGANQGLFRVVRDEATGREYVLTYDRRAVLRVDARGEIVVGDRLERILNGKPEFHKPAKADWSTRRLPRRAASSPSRSSRVQPSEPRSLRTTKVLTLEGFVQKVRSELYAEGEGQ